MPKNYDDMTVEDLEIVVAELETEREVVTAEHREAGKALDRKRSEQAIFDRLAKMNPEERAALAKVASDPVLMSEIEARHNETPAPQVVSAGFVESEAEVHTPRG